MRYLVMVSILLVATGTGQSQGKSKYETVPNHVVLVAIAFQANCPLKIEDATFLKRVDQPGGMIKYRLRNVSNKPIEWVSVTIRHWSGSGGNSTPMPRVKKVLLPNETLEAASEPIDYEIVAVYKSDQKPSSREEMKTLCILLVDKVLFTDGSVYEDSETLDALDRFLEDFCNR
jgi:hypothetical protein